MVKIIIIYFLFFCISYGYSQDKETTLKHGQIYNEKLLNGEKQKYKIKLSKGEFCTLIVRQLGVDVVIDLSDPSFKKINSFDSPNGNHGPEYIEFAAGMEGLYHLEIYPLNDYSGMTEAQKNQYIEQNQGNYQIDSIKILSKEKYGIKLSEEKLKRDKFIESLNLGFEKTTPGNNVPDGWYQDKQSAFNLKIDTIEKHSGKNSILLERDKQGAPFESVLHSVPAAYQGNEIEVKAYLKMKNVAEGPIGLMLCLDEVDNVLEFDNMEQKNIQGTADWKEYSVKLPFPVNTRKIYIGALLMGTGQLWADDFQLLIDGKNISELNYTEPKKYKAESDIEFNEGSRISSIELSDSNINNLVTLGKLWGFLKYYHPVIAKGEYNWDYELFRIMPKILAASNPQDRNADISDWIAGLGKIDTGKASLHNTGEVKISPDLSWINNPELGEKLTAQLNNIKDARRENENYYIGLFPGIHNPDFKNERSYRAMNFPDAGFRLLSLYRFWNIIEYYFPSKYLIGENWNDVLKEFIPKFVNASDEQEYKLTALALIARIHDTHASIRGDMALENYRGKNYAPVEITFVENKALVTDYHDKDLGERSGLKIGDIIETINNKSVDEIIAERSPYYPASNSAMQLRNMAINLLRTNDTILNISYKRGGEVLNSQIECFSSDKINVYKKYQKRDTCFKMINSEISYLYPGSIKNVYLPEIMPEILKTKGLIIDLRCYPSEFIVFTLSKYLQPNLTGFVKFTEGSITTPGLFTMTPVLDVGGKNENPYRGKVVILVNEQTQSQAEYTTMAFRTIPNAIVIGSTTAGADGNVSDVILPGGIKTWISGLVVYYPDGKETQRVGIVPDIEVKPTIEGISKGRDEVLEKAIEIINEK